MTKHKMDVQAKESELIITRIFDAQPKLVFESYSDCEHLKHWWGPREWPLSSCNMDFREGGAWHYCMKGPGGELACGKAIYQEIKKPEKIQYKDHFTDEEGNVNKEMPAMLITVEFFGQKGKTKLVSHILFDSPDNLQSVLDMGMIEGFGETWDRLEEHLAGVTATK